MVEVYTKGREELQELLLKRTASKPTGWKPPFQTHPSTVPNLSLKVSRVRRAMT